MSVLFKVRDLVSPRNKVLDEVGLLPGDRVLDYGCGLGAYVSGVAERVGAAGKIVALDLHPLAIDRVQALARREGLENVQTIQSGCETGLPDGSVDVVLLYDIYHMLSEPQAVLAELHRILVPGGKLSVLDPHIDEAKVLSGITGNRLFKLARAGEHTFSFTKR